MSEHEPECYALTHRDSGDDCCICDRLRQAEQRGFDKGFTDGMTWRIGGPSAVEYWQGQERDRIRDGLKALSWFTEQEILAVIDPKEGPDD